jgi:hypothetical protein
LARAYRQLVQGEISSFTSCVPPQRDLIRRILEIGI